MLYQHVDAVPDSPNRHRSDLPKAFAAFVMQLLAKYPEARPTAAEAVEFLASAEQWSAGQPSSGEFTPSAAGVPGRSAKAVSQGAVRQKEPGSLRSLRSRVATGSLVAAVAAAAVVSLSAAPPIAEDGRKAAHLDHGPALTDTRHSERDTASPVRPGRRHRNVVGREGVRPRQEGVDGQVVLTVGEADAHEEAQAFREAHGHRDALAHEHSDPDGEQPADAEPHSAGGTDWNVSVGSVSVRSLSCGMSARGAGAGRFRRVFLRWGLHRRPSRVGPFDRAPSGQAAVRGDLPRLP